MNGMLMMKMSKCQEVVNPIQTTSLQMKMEKARKIQLVGQNRASREKTCYQGWYSKLYGIITQGSSLDFKYIVFLQNGCFLFYVL